MTITLNKVRVRYILCVLLCANGLQFENFTLGHPWHAPPALRQHGCCRCPGAKYVTKSHEPWRVIFRSHCNVQERAGVTGEFPIQRAINAENVPIWWRHHVCIARGLCDNSFWLIILMKSGALHNFSLETMVNTLSNVRQPQNI